MARLHLCNGHLMPVVSGQSGETDQLAESTSIMPLSHRRHVTLDRAYIRGFAFADHDRVIGASSSSWGDGFPSRLHLASFSNSDESPSEPYGFCLTTLR